MAADPLDRIADICHDQPHDALTQIAEVLGFPARPPAWLLTEDMQALQRFCETCEDSQPYDVPKDRMRRLAELGAIQWCGGSRYSITAFGQHVLDLLPEGWPRLPLKTQADHDADSRAAFERAMGVTAAPAFHYSFVCYSCRKEWEDTKPESDCPDPACGTTNSYSAKDAAPGVMADARACTCHPDDNPPKPCPRKFALTECRAAGMRVDARSLDARIDSIADICEQPKDRERAAQLIRELLADACGVTLPPGGQQR